MTALQDLLDAACRAEELIPIEELEEHANRRRHMGYKKDWDLVTIDYAECKYESDGGALKILIDGDEHWIPSKLVNTDSECYAPGTSGTLIIPTWLATEKGLM